MQIRFFLIFSILVLSLIPGCKYVSKDKVILKGTFTSFPEKQLYLYQILPSGKQLIDSVNTDATGTFCISIPVINAGYYLLHCDEANEITLVISPGERVAIKGDGHSIRNTYTIEGSRDSKLYTEYSRFTDANLARVDSLSRIFTESRTNPDFLSVKNNLDSAYMHIFNDQKEQVISFVSGHLSSLASLLAISNNFGPNSLISEQTHPLLFLKLDSALVLAYPKNSLVNTFHLRMLDFKTEIADILKHDRILKPGLPAPEIILPDLNGKKIKLSSLRGKLTLVLFWSSWDARCRQANMNLANIYSKYHDGGFEIYAVSIDSNSGLWEKAYLLDKSYWIQVIDTKGLESEYCKTYALKAIPTTMLIGKDGNIIARNPDIRELETLIKKNL